MIGTILLSNLGRTEEMQCDMHCSHSCSTLNIQVVGWGSVLRPLRKYTTIPVGGVIQCSISRWIVFELNTYMHSPETRTVARIKYKVKAKPRLSNYILAIVWVMGYNLFIPCCPWWSGENRMRIVLAMESEKGEHFPSISNGALIPPRWFRHCCQGCCDTFARQQPKSVQTFCRRAILDSKSCAKDGGLAVRDYRNKHSDEVSKRW